MRILFLNQFFFPDHAPTGRLLADVARHLAADGHDVAVICSRSRYENRGPGLIGEEEGELAGIAVSRIPALAFAPSAAGRVASYLSFAAGAAWHALRAPHPDLVVTLTTPPFLCVIGTLLKFLRGTRHVCWEMDVYPDIAFDVGLLSRAAIPGRVLGAILDYSRRRSDGIIALGECMKERLTGHGLPTDRIHVVENWAHGASFNPAWPHDAPPWRILYAGHLGIGHDIDTIAGVFDLEAFEFVFSGGGPGHSRLMDYCKRHQYARVSFLPYVSDAAFPEYLRQSHIGLVTQRESCCGSIVPSKTYAIMGAGRPVLFIGPKRATPARIIERYRCGWQVEPGDKEGLRTLMQRLAAESESLEAAGARARAAFLSDYEVSAGVRRMENVLASAMIGPAGQLQAAAK